MLAEILAAVVIALLRYLQGREDLKASIRADLEKESLRYANAALVWKARAAGEPAAEYLRVRNGSSLSLHSRNPNVDGRTDLP